MLSLLAFLIACDSPTRPPETKPPEPKPAATPAPTAAPAAAPSPTEVAANLNVRPLMMMAMPEATSAASTTPNGGPGTAATFAVYILALSWEPSFCCTSAGKSKTECKEMMGTYGADHLTLHGLWPNYSDQQATSSGSTYPQYCAPYGSCQKTDSPGCDPNPSTIPADMATYGPGYVTDNYQLANHEWPRHGSCTGLDSGTFFQAGLDTLKALPGGGTPAILKPGATIKRTDLAAAFGQADAVMLQCSNGQLSQVEICYTVDASGKPGKQTTCPDSARKTPYDNSCELSQVDNVIIPVAGQCSSGGSSGGGSASGGGSGTCDAAKGQGPACSDDTSCKSANYLRCAHSGCCTNQPL